MPEEVSPMVYTVPFLYIWDSVYFLPLYFEGFGLMIPNYEGFVLSLLPRKRTFARKGGIKSLRT